MGWVVSFSPCSVLLVIDVLVHTRSKVSLAVSPSDQRDMLVTLYRHFGIQHNPVSVRGFFFFKKNGVAGSQIATQKRMQTALQSQYASK